MVVVAFFFSSSSWCCLAVATLLSNACFLASSFFLAADTDFATSFCCFADQAAVAAIALALSSLCFQVRSSACFWQDALDSTTSLSALAFALATAAFYKQARQLLAVSYCRQS